MFPPPLPSDRNPQQPAADSPPPRKKRPRSEYLAVALIPLGFFAYVTIGRALKEVREPGSTLQNKSATVSTKPTPASSQTPPPSPAPAQSQPANSFTAPIPNPPADPQQSISAAEQARNQQMDGEIARIGRKIFGDGFLEVKSADTAEGWKLDVKIFDTASDPGALQRKIKQLSVACHPPGMKVRRLSLDVSTEFTTDDNRTVTERLMLLMLDPDKAAALDWENPSFRFHDAFKTIAVSSLYREHWINANES